jgi:hypothetical protein
MNKEIVIQNTHRNNNLQNYEDIPENSDLEDILNAHKASIQSLGISEDDSMDDLLSNDNMVGKYTLIYLYLEWIDQPIKEWVEVPLMQSSQMVQLIQSLLEL